MRGAICSMQRVRLMHAACGLCTAFVQKSVCCMDLQGRLLGSPWASFDLLGTPWLGLGAGVSACQPGFGSWGGKGAGGQGKRPQGWGFQGVVGGPTINTTVVLTPGEDPGWPCGPISWDWRGVSPATGPLGGLALATGGGRPRGPISFLWRPRRRCASWRGWVGRAGSGATWGEGFQGVVSLLTISILCWLRGRTRGGPVEPTGIG